MHSTARHLSIVFLFLVGFATAQTPTEQDCLGAIPICNDIISVPNPYPYSGNGNYLNEILAVLTCYTAENNGIWYTFTVQASGLLRFTLSPNDPNDDYDWILYNMNTTSCAALSTFAGVGAMASSNNWGVFGLNGDIGISTANGGVGNCNGPGNFNGPKWNADLPVVVGSTYVLYVSNWSNSTSGFSLDFSTSTAVIFDNVPPVMDTITSAIACDPFDSLVIEFSENIKCTSVQPADFELVGPGGPYTITGTSSATCNAGGDYDDTYTVSFSPSVSAIGSYSLAIKPGAGFVEDLCGNLDTLDSLHFDYNGFVDVSIAFTEPECNAYCTGTLSASSIDGTAPYQFNWSSGLGIDSNQTGICAGTYTVTITDDLGCTATETAVLGEPTAINTTLVDVTHITCFGVTNCEGAAEVASTGGTPSYTYQWPNGENTFSPGALCAGSNWVTVTDANGCLDSLDVNIQIPFPIQTVGSGDTLICISNVTPINAASIGGTPPYSYAWHKDSLGGPTIATSQSHFVSPSKSTSYVVFSTDANGCAGDTSLVQVDVRNRLRALIEATDTICPNEMISITATGLGGDGNYTYAWQDAGIGQTATVSPSLSRWYRITVSDACGTPSAIDSVFVQVGGYSDIDVNIRVNDDSLCVGEEATLIASSRGGYNGAEEYVFNWSHTQEDYQVQFASPNATRNYMVSVSDLCLSKPGVDTITIYVGQPEKPTISIHPNTACAESEVVLSIPEFKAGYRYDWSLGDGYVSPIHSDDTLFHGYRSVGCYSIGLNTWTDFGCYSEQLLECGVEIFQRPKADFSQEPETPTNLNSILEFQNQSKFHTEHLWIIDQDTLWNTDQFNREFYDRYDPVKVRLIAKSADGCADTTVKSLEYIHELSLYYPSSFTPNGDGRNDEFLVKGIIAPEDFQLTIFDRWGSQVFLSRNPKYGWDGKVDQLAAPLGVYVFELKYRDGEGLMQVVQDQLTISKTDER